MRRGAGAALRALRGLIEVHTRALDEDLPGALQDVVERVAEVLEVRAVAINLLRPAWDDFEIAAIHASPEVVRARRGGTVPRRTIERLLDPAFDVGGAHFIPAGSVDATDLGGAGTAIPRGERADHPDRWREQDELIVPIRSTEGELIGFMSIGEPISGTRPGPDQIELAVLVAEAAAAAVRGARRALEARSNREALELLFELSASLTNDDDVDSVLHVCCDGIRRALGFERVVIEIADEDTNEMRVRAAIGWEDGAPEGMSSLDDVERLCDPAHEIEGCYLWPAEEAMARVGHEARRYESQRNGVGPLAWDHHWLVVPLRHPDGSIGGWVWPDDPADHLLPTPQRLRILRTFANQAMVAVSDATHVDQLKALARVDELTGVLNRRAFFERFDTEVERARRAKAPVTLVLYDLDGFKALNDVHGHPAGDAALRAFARILEGNVRSSDAVGRVGGDEFALVLAGADHEDVEKVLDRVSSTLEMDPLPLGAVRASYGISRTPDDGWTRDELVEAADRRLYDQKRRRQIRVVPGESGSG